VAIADRQCVGAEFAFYSSEYERTGFQGGLQWYRARNGGLFDAELQLLSGRTIDVPSIFIAGKTDWGAYQRPGNFERVQHTTCTRMLGYHLIDGADHWVQLPSGSAATAPTVANEDQVARCPSRLRPLDYRAHLARASTSLERAGLAFFREGAGGFLEILGEVELQRRGLHCHFALELVHVPAAGAHCRANR
jgi:hypothetical protein